MEGKLSMEGKGQQHSKEMGQKSPSILAGLHSVDRMGTANSLEDSLNFCSLAETSISPRTQSQSPSILYFN